MNAIVEMTKERSIRGGAMSQAWALFKRELISYFLSPMSYMVWAVFLVASGYMFATGIRDGGSASMSPTFGSIAMLLIFITPLITMRLIAEELRTGKLEILLTDPVGDFMVIASKFAASFVFFAMMLAPTLAYPAILASIGQPDPGPVLAGYLGLLLMGALFLAIGIMTSAVMTNQIAAATLSFTIIMMFWALGRAADSIGPGKVQDVLSYVSAFSRYSSFIRGLVDTRSLFYFLSAAAFSLLLATRALGLRRLK